MPWSVCRERPDPDPATQATATTAATSRRADRQQGDCQALVFMMVTMNHLGPRVTDRPDREAAAARNRVAVIVLCARHGILREVEDAAQDHVIACLVAGAKLKP